MAKDREAPADPRQRPLLPLLDLMPAAKAAPKGGKPDPRQLGLVADPAEGGAS